MRYITFGKYSPSFDGAYFMKQKRETSSAEEYIYDLDSRYPMLNTENRRYEEWPSEKWNYQDKYPLKSIKTMEVNVPIDSDEASLNTTELSEEELHGFLTSSVKGIGNKKATAMLEEHGKKGLIEIIENNPNTLLNIEGMKEKTLKKLLKQWGRFKEMLNL
jgi:hypothetical protein